VSDDAKEELQERLGRVEALVRAVEDLPDEKARDAAREVVAAVLELHGAALARIVSTVAGKDGILAALAADETVSSVLVLHDLHPQDLEARVRAALERLRTGLVLRGARADLEKLGGDEVRVRVVREAQGCGSDFAKLRAMVEEGLGRAAPEVPSIVVEVTQETPSAFIPVEKVKGARHE